MLLDFFGVHENPFGVTPETRFLYPSHVHEEARASLSHSFQSGRGFVVLIGQPGMGKTTLLMDFLQKLKNSARIAFLFQTQCTAHDFLEQLMLEFDLGIRSESAAQLHDRLRAFLAKEHSTGKRVVIVVDEAQNLTDEVLETVRLLSDFETQRTKLLHIVLSGQPQLAEKLTSPGLLQLRQRIGMLCRLSALNEKETREYIDYRLMVAGRPIAHPLFSDGAYKMIAEVSKGIPRNINNICFHALSIAYPLNEQFIDINIIDEAIRDIDISKESVLGRKPCVITAPANGNKTTSRSLEPKPVIAEPKTTPQTFPPTAATYTAAAVSSTGQQELQPSGSARERFRWPESSSIPQVDSHIKASPVQRNLNVIAHIPTIGPTTSARGNGAMPAIPVSGYWELQNGGDAVDDRRSLRSQPAQVLTEAPQTNKTYSQPQKVNDGASHSQKINAVAPTISSSALFESQKQVGTRQILSRNAVILIIALILFIGALVALWPTPASMPVQASGNSAADKEPPQESRAAAHESKTKPRRKPGKQPGNKSNVLVAADSPSLRDQERDQPVRADHHPASWKADVARTGDVPLLSMTEPIYPVSARDSGHEGTVVVDAIVDRAGKVVAIAPVSGDPQLVAAAIDAVKQWRYDPQGLALKQGSIHEKVSITFTLR